ncbi:Cobalamin synthase [Caloramator mitchellensis]|uniref:Adenosylcobinamide-GDP ribazoletransferase n=1 Tax=Caloramator mitchellensis TaxID=908809 RepID=A0A0R3JSI6_CALMK|nr:adenosylcobinamide-GDP ribazoletransferase [Caloramator mitchellensis]KRQ85930.1 Cobalamin synthase [Caloramator mitchellensis]
MIKAFILAIQFLTRLPLNIQVDFDERTIKKSTAFFPFVGVIIASIVYIPFRLLISINEEIAALITLFVWISITGGLHVDGLSDTADGFLSGRKKEKILEIMKDSRIGAFGVIAVVFDLLFKFIIIKNLRQEGALIGLIVSIGLSRLLVTYLFAVGKSARNEGLGILFTGKETIKYSIIGLLTFSLVGIYLVALRYVLLLFIGWLITYVLMKISYKKIDGLTGDVYGACIEINEILLLLLWVVIQWI